MNDNTVKPNTELVKLTMPCKLLQSAWQIYTYKFWLFIKVFLYTLLGTVPLVICVIAYMVISEINLSEPLSSAIKIIIGFLGLASVFIVVYYSIRSKVGSFLVCEENKNTTAQEVFKNTKNIAWPFFVVSLVSGILVILWSILFIIPGIIFGVYYTFSPLIVIFENKKPWESIKESKGLIKNYWWAVFGRLVFIGLAISIISLIFAGIGELMPEKSIYFALWNFITQTILVIISPLVISYIYLLYKNLKSVKGI